MERKNTNKNKTKAKKVNNVLSLILILFSLIFTVSGAVNCDDLYEVVDKYYKISQDENYNEYIKLMDTDYIYKNLADEESYKNYVKSAFEVYETKDYEIKYHKCNEIYDGKEALVFFNMESTISAEGKDFDLQRDYVASLRNVNNVWKIQFVMDLETFSFHQNMMYNLMYLNETKEILVQNVEDLEEYEAYLENIEKIESEIEENSSSSFLYWILIIVISIVLFLIARKFGHKIVHTVKNKTKKEHKQKESKNHNEHKKDSKHKK